MFCFSTREFPCLSVAPDFKLISNRLLLPPEFLKPSMTPVGVGRRSPSSRFSHFRRGCFGCGSRRGPHRVFIQLSYLHRASGCTRGPTYFCLTLIGDIAALGSLVDRWRVARCQQRT